MMSVHHHAVVQMQADFVLCCDMALGMPMFK